MRDATETEKGLVLVVAVVVLAAMNIAIVWMAWVVQYQREQIEGLKKLLGW
jgi:hypothetical protein